MLSELVYISRASSLMAAEQLEDILNVARNFNSSKNITGLLLYKDQSFLQLLEGERDDIEALYKDIKSDKRHFRVKTLIEGPIEERSFSEWSMAFQNLDDFSLDHLPGFSNYMNMDYQEELVVDRKSEAHQLLMYFRQTS